MSIFRPKTFETEIEKLDVKILSPMLLNANDIIMFKITSNTPLSETELEAAKALITKLFVSRGIENQVVVLNNCDIEAVRSLLK